MSGPTPVAGRRISRSIRPARRWDPTLFLSLGLPLLLVLAIALTRPSASHIVPAPAASTDLTSAEVICPSALDGKKATATQIQQLSAGVVTTAPASQQTVIRASGVSAPGLTASLSSTSPLTVWDCTPPVGEQWFTGVGAGPTQASVVELVNPNGGPAVADIEVLSDEGLLDVPHLRGVAVAANAIVQLDLGQLIPRTGVMALHVTVVRGQLGVAVRDRGERLTGGTSTEEWLPPQTGPSRHNIMLGLQPGHGRNSLVVANGGDNQVSATVKLITPDSTFAPDGLKPIQVPPHSAVRAFLDDTIKGAVAAGSLGLEIDATGPVTTSLRSVIGGDLSFLVPGETISDATTLILPPGRRRLDLAGAVGVGVATVVGHDAAGRELLRQRVALTPERGASLDLPAGVASVDVTPERTSIQGAVLVTGGGSAVVRLRTLLRTGAVPTVSFGP